MTASPIVAKTPTSQLAEIRARIAAATTEIARFDSEIARRAMPILTGDVEAARVATAIEWDKQALAGELATLRNAESQLAATVAAEVAAIRRAEAAAVPRQVAEAAEAMLAGDDEIDQLAHALASAIKNRVAAGASLAELVGGVRLQKVHETVISRIQSAVAPVFQTSGPAITDNREGRTGQTLNLLGMVPTQSGGAAAWKTLRQLDEATLDDEAPYRTTRAAAEDAAARLAERGCKVLVHELPGGTFTLIRVDDLYVDREAADRAAEMAARVPGSTRPAVVPFRSGYVIRPPRLADAIMASEAAA